MAMTASEWARFQAMLPQEDRMSYREYLASVGTTPTPQVQATTAQAATAPAQDTSFTAAERAIFGEAATMPAPAPAQTAAVTTAPATTETATSAVTGGAATSATTGGTTGGITQAELDAAIKSALATQASAFARQQQEAAAQAAAQREAERRSTRQKASDRLVAMFDSYKLGNLAKFIDERIMNDVSEDMLMLEIYERPEYKTRFPGMAELRKAGKAISEAAYMGIEKQMEQTARFFDLPKGFYDGPEDFGNLIGKQVSAKEFQDRLQVGQDLARTLNPYVKEALSSLYGVGEGALTAYVLDPDKALSVIQKQAKAAQFVGYAREAGFGLASVTPEVATDIAGTAPYASLSEQQMQKSLQQAGQLRREQSRLAGIEGEVYQEQEALDAVISGSSEALLASQRRAQREVARFGERGGVTATSLARPGTI